MYYIRHLLAILILLIFSCKKDTDIINSNTDSFIRTSTDTLMFNTIFTTTLEDDVSPTRYFKIYNNNSNDITIESIFLNSLELSNYRLNVDGEAGYIIHNTLLREGDSLYVFANVRSDPNIKEDEFVVEDDIIFLHEGKEKSIKLLGLGQNACYYSGIPDYQQKLNEGYTQSGCGSGELNIVPVCEYNLWDCDDPNFPEEYLNSNYAYFSISEDTEWNSNKPHVIIGHVVVENAQLDITAGTNIYLHNNASLIINDNSSLHSIGNSSIGAGKGAETFVTFQSHRSDNHSIIDYSQTPGQWGRILLTSGSSDNIFEWTTIKNGTTGIQIFGVNNIDLLPLSPQLIINNSIIYNMAEKGIAAGGTKIEAENLLIFNCGINLLDLSFGGDYIFNHCTFANFWSFTARQTPSILLNNYYYDVNEILQNRPLIQASFGNCIIDGYNDNEIFFDNSNEVEFSYHLNHCLLKLDANYWDEWQNQESIESVLSTNGNFIDYELFDFNLDSNSLAIDAGIDLGINIDLNGAQRDQNPDIGCFEYY